MTLKKKLEAAILAELANHSGKQKVIAEHFGLHQCDVSALRRGVGALIISTDKMIAIAGAMGIGCQVELTKVDPVPMVGRGAIGPIVLDDIQF